MNGKKRRILTGLQPSGSPHLGNYLGAIQPAINLSNSHELFLFLADFHTLNNVNDRQTNWNHSIDLAATLLACGFDHKKHIFYAQSMVPEVTELTWVLSCMAPYGMLQRAHSFKDKQAKNIEVNCGLFNYPILMAADILLYHATHVPVGKDQKQHLEMTRDLAVRFNNAYGEQLTLPEPIISEEVGLIPGIDGEKMSKSKNNVISIFATDKQWKKQIMSIVTDSLGVEDKKDPEACNVFAIYKLLATPEQIAAMAESYRAGGYGYGHAKLALLECVKERFSAARDQYNDLIARPDDVVDILKEGSSRARQFAARTLQDVRQAMGLVGGHAK